MTCINRCAEQTPAHGAHMPAGAMHRPPSLAFPRACLSTPPTRALRSSRRTPTHIIGSTESYFCCSTVGEAIAENQIGERSRWGGAPAVAGGRTGDQPSLAKACEAARARVDRGSR